MPGDHLRTAVCVSVGEGGVDGLGAGVVGGGAKVEHVGHFVGGAQDSGQGAGGYSRGEGSVWHL